MDIQYGRGCVAGWIVDRLERLPLSDTVMGALAVARTLNGVELAAQLEPWLSANHPGMRDRMAQDYRALNNCHRVMLLDPTYRAWGCNSWVDAAAKARVGMVFGMTVLRDLVTLGRLSDPVVCERQEYWLGSVEMAQKLHEKIGPDLSVTFGAQTAGAFGQIKSQCSRAYGVATISAALFPPAPDSQLPSID